MTVIKHRPLLWILAPLFLVLAGVSVWGTLQFTPIGKPAHTTYACKDLRSFILAEEVDGRREWNSYRDLVNQYLALPQGSNKSAIVEEIAFTVTQVLGHDLDIYYEMERNSDCLLSEKRDELPGIIAETESAINFLNGSEAIDGSFFDPEMGSWNPEYYSEFVSATEFLKDQAILDADL